MGVAFSIAVAIIISGFLWFYIVRPILEDYEVIGPRVVSYSQVDNHVMSRENEQTDEIAPVRDSGSVGSDDPVRGHQNQIEPTEPVESVPVSEPLILHNLSRSALIALLSVQKNDSNGYRFSKNQIAAFVGGTKADVLKEIDLYRPKASAEKVPHRTGRPINGWGN